MSNTTTHQQTEPPEQATYQTRTFKTREAREDAAKKLEAHGCNTLHRYVNSTGYVLNWKGPTT
jgi:hypothetical protein